MHVKSAPCFFFLFGAPCAKAWQLATQAPVGKASAECEVGRKAMTRVYEVMRTPFDLALLVERYGLGECGALEVSRQHSPASI